MPIPILITAVNTPKPIWMPWLRDAIENPDTEASVIAEFETMRPSTNTNRTTIPAHTPPADAAARNTTTWVGVSAPTPWIAPIPIATTIRVEGTVARVRERAGSYFVTFEVRASDDRGPVLESRSTFVLSNRVAPRPELIRNEPPVRERGSNEAGERSASRHDLIRYAAATRDFNPLHWDHTFAVDSGLSGTVVHGLLMYAWMVEQASSAARGRKVAAAKIRFRSALHPGQQAVIETTVVGDVVSVMLSCADSQLVTGSVTLATQGE
jgi:acyl dehydratase